MTQKEKQKLQDCRIHIVGHGRLSEFIGDELHNIGFCQISQSDNITDITGFDIIIMAKTGQQTANVPMLYPFDLIEGGAAIVVLPGDGMAIPVDADARVWAANYMIGYSTFWNIRDLDWLRESLPGIKNGVTSEQSQRTAAVICARICANIAVGRDVKHFPRFYLSRNLE